MPKDARYPTRGVTPSNTLSRIARAGWLCLETFSQPRGLTHYVGTPEGDLVARDVINDLKLLEKHLKTMYNRSPIPADAYETLKEEQQ